MQGDFPKQRQQVQLQDLTKQLEIVVQIAMQLSLIQGKWPQLDDCNHLQVPKSHPCCSTASNP